jgi:hypothetical protein
MTEAINFPLWQRGMQGDLSLSGKSTLALLWERREF